jgi:hypothetical protein
MEIRVAIFEDNSNMREGLFQLINGSGGFSCTGAFPNCDDLVKRITGGQFRNDHNGYSDPLYGNLKVK